MCNKVKRIFYFLFFELKRVKNRRVNYIHHYLPVYRMKSILQLNELFTISFFFRQKRREDVATIGTISLSTIKFKFKFSIFFLRNVFLFLFLFLSLSRYFKMVQQRFQIKIVQLTERKIATARVKDEKRKE